ncbi:MAG TPA: CAP domain-containing protein [Candidatus Polarisedimenticolaceae bacterium]|nr:CAP domain-containing protein [Candidatus Polarisedimenticolaceae bacterium]
MRVLPALVFALALTAVESASPEQVGESLLSEIRAARARASVPPASEPAAASRVARERAEEAAGLPARRRLSSGTSTVEALRKAGLTRIVEAREYMQEQEGYADAAAAAVRGFRDHPLWRRALDLEVTAIGAGAAQARDGTVIAVVLLLEEEPVRDLREMESETEKAVNRVRARHGLRSLVPDPALIRVARAHSEDMVRRHYFDHEDPEGRRAADRVTAAGISWSKVSENLAMNAGMDDPVARAVEGWMDSPGHRANILDSAVTHTGVGIAEEDGSYTFTQVFAAPRGNGK